MGKTLYVEYTCMVRSEKGDNKIMTKGNGQ